MVKQGDIIEIENLNRKLLVVSRNLLNENEVCVVVPMGAEFEESVTHLKNTFSEELLITEQLRYIDLSARFYKVVGCLPLAEMQIVVDVIQSLFEVI